MQKALRQRKSARAIQSEENDAEKEQKNSISINYQRRVGEGICCFSNDEATQRKRNQGKGGEERRRSRKRDWEKNVTPRRAHTQKKTHKQRDHTNGHKLLGGWGCRGGGRAMEQMEGRRCVESDTGGRPSQWEQPWGGPLPSSSLSSPISPTHQNRPSKKSGDGVGERVRVKQSDARGATRRSMQTSTQ